MKEDAAAYTTGIFNKYLRAGWRHFVSHVSLEEVDISLREVIDESCLETLYRCLLWWKNLAFTELEEMKRKTPENP